MKKLFKLVLSLAMVFSLLGCSSKDLTDDEIQEKIDSLNYDITIDFDSTNTGLVFYLVAPIDKEMGAFMYWESDELLCFTKVDKEEFSLDDVLYMYDINNDDCVSPVNHHSYIGKMEEDTDEMKENVNTILKSIGIDKERLVEFCKQEIEEKKANITAVEQLQHIFPDNADQIAKMDEDVAKHYLDLHENNPDADFEDLYEEYMVNYQTDGEVWLFILSMEAYGSSAKNPWELTNFKYTKGTDYDYVISYSIATTEGEDLYTTMQIMFNYGCSWSKIIFTGAGATTLGGVAIQGLNSEITSLDKANIIIQRAYGNIYQYNGNSYYCKNNLDFEILRGTNWSLKSN